MSRPPTGRDVQSVARSVGLSSCTRARTDGPGTVRAYVDADDAAGYVTAQTIADARADRLARALELAGWSVTRSGPVLHVTART